MGFLSVYSGTRRVAIGDPARGYWAELRECMPQGAKAEAERALLAAKVVGKDTEMAMDTATYRELMVLGSIIAWNLDDEDGTVWPLTLESVRRLPGIEFDRLHKIVDEMNEPRSAEERRQFPAEGLGGDPDGERGTIIPGLVLDRDADMAAPWAATGGPGAPPLA